VADKPLNELDLIAGGSLCRIDQAAGETADTLRNALDAALSSPSQIGIAVDADGAVAGGISADTVLATLAAARAAGEIPV